MQPLLLGRVGKTSILSRYFNKQFSETEQSTVNPSFYEKIVPHGGVSYKFCFWDTAGQEIFNAITPIYYRDAQGALLVYDVTQQETFAKVENWITQLETFNKNTKLVIVGNKVDKVSSLSDLEKNSVTIKDYARSKAAEFFYTSAKSGQNLDKAFDHLINVVLEKQKSNGAGAQSKNMVITSASQTSNKKEGCCK